MKKKELKIGIITMYYGNRNYGAVLQAYALQKVVSDLGFDCEQISYTNRNSTSGTFVQRLYWNIRKFGIVKVCSQLLNILLSKTPKKDAKLAFEQIEKRFNAVDIFANSIRHSKTTYDIQSIVHCQSYDAYICGSDQVWRTGWGYLNPGFWLTFVKNGARKIAYAPSVSMNKIPRNEYKLIRAALSDFHSISVREKQGCQLIKTILNNKQSVECVLDPTLLLRKEDWLSIAASNPHKNQKYIFVYLLGDSVKHRMTAADISSKLDVNIITIPYLSNTYRECDKDFGAIHISDVSPNLFLSLIRDAQLVITDSFHACVFSAIFSSNFLCFKRDNDESVTSMNSRISNLLELLHEEDRLVNDDANIEDICRLIMNNDGKSFIFDDLLNEQMSSLSYLQKSLQIDNHGI